MYERFGDYENGSGMDCVEIEVCRQGELEDD